MKPTPNFTLTRYGERGWIWETEDTETRTNGDGEGLFRRQSDGSWQQIFGTSQYRAPHTRNGMRRQLRQALADPSDWRI